MGSHSVDQEQKRNQMRSHGLRIFHVLTIYSIYCISAHSIYFNLIFPKRHDADINQQDKDSHEDKNHDDDDDDDDDDDYYYYYKR